MNELNRKLEYPFDSEWIIENRKRIRRELLSEDNSFIEKRIAVLGGSTTKDIISILEIFLLNVGIKATFYESEYNKYWEDAIFGNTEFDSFDPDIIWIHTSSRNILSFPSIDEKEEDIQDHLNQEYHRYTEIWDSLQGRFNCALIQNNFELPFCRALGNLDAVDSHGKTNFVTQLNEMFYQYARKHENFYINDINYLSSCYGLQQWADPSYWYRYKYALNFSAIPELAYNVSLIIKAIFGKNKKALVLDLDNTLWGGVISEDGIEGIQIGKETAEAEMYTEFQEYLYSNKNLGILLTVDSKNDENIALEGINHPENVLKREDFVSIKTNWEPKDQNILAIAQELNIGTDSLVFVDDNPVEREIVRQNVPEVVAPEFDKPEDYIRILDRSGFFEPVALSADDRKRTEMYIANSQRQELKAKFSNYEDFLKSLEMEAEIRPFDRTSMARLAQLTNKSNQFNLTTRRCTQSELEIYAEDADYITLYGRLKDKFGDNGIVTVMFGHLEKQILNIDLWLMSCRVLKRNMEHAMMDSLVDICKARGIKEIVGYYYPTAKNGMVKDFYKGFGYSLISEGSDGSTVWELLVKDYHKLNHVITIKED